MIDMLVKEELSRINAEPVLSEYEDTVKSDIMIWGYQQNIDRMGEGKSIVKYDTFKDLVTAYWAEQIGSFGKLRAIR
jgi:hypothetical protein